MLPNPYPNVMKPVVIPRGLSRATLTALVWSASVVGCTTTTEKPVTFEEVDADSDGILEGSDCNDRDPTIFPGAEDAWYDGVDQDCAGDDDFDADSDGHRSVEYGGLDCDDADATISPDATETWYDGVDQDCAGDNDFDADRDGYATDGSEGDVDCDDNRSDVKPGALEIWYDGVDGDCAGDDDFDADGDGFASALYLETGTDCDDSADDINPDAEEVWYDGIDSDCLGDNDFDADGDGESAEGEVASGTDCNDQDPSIFSGAPERLDDEDSDCDGEDDVFTSDQDVLGSHILGQSAGDGLGLILASGNIDNDVYTDLAVVSTADDGLTTGGDGVVYFIDGQSLSDGPLVADISLDSVVGGAKTTTATGPIAAVAVLGKYADPSSTVTQFQALVGTPDHTVGADRVGAAWMILATLPNLSTLTSTTTSQKFFGEVADSDFGAVVLGDADFDLDGDGMRDVVISAPGDEGGKVYVFRSSTIFSSTGDFAASDADIIFTGASADGELGASLAAGDFTAGDDADDDGDAWLVIGDPQVNSGQGAVYVLTDSDMTSGPIDDRAMATVVGTPGSNLGAAVATGNTLQEDTDIQDELIIGAPRAVTRAGQLQFFDGAAIFDASTSASAATFECSSSGSGSDCYLRYTGSAIDGFAGSALASGYDVTGNGTDDLLVGGPGNAPNGAGSGAVWMVADDLPSNGQSLINASGVFNGASAGDGLGSSLALGDFNGDGRGDVVYGVPGHDISGDEGMVRMYTSQFPAEGE